MDIQVVESPVGTLLAKWSSGGLYSFEFDKDNLAQSFSNSTNHTLACELEARLANYFQTGEFQWDLEQLDWSGITDFQQLVLKHCYAIESGSSITYNELASLAGSPKAARAVGSVMAKNRWPILIPCHRVVGSTGKLTGYSGLGGLETKRRLLDFESGQQLFELAWV